MPVFLASDISSRSGQAERINAAAVNAYIHAKLVRLLYKAGEELRRRLYRRSLLIVHNNGQAARVAKTRAINTYNSGPAAGLLGAGLIGGLYGVQDLISVDMGGTSFDVGYVRQGQPSYDLNGQVEGLPVNLPMLAIRAIGAGGGSIASVTDGKLQVGPQSAGALPGPVCFDLGGMEPTVTDADLLLGILAPDYFLGGSLKLNVDKASQAVKGKVADPLGTGLEEASWSVKTLIDKAMGRQVGKLKAELGQDFDPLLVVYGGAGPAHCCGIAKSAGLKKIVMTPFSAVFSAFSSSTMDVGHIYYRRVDQPFGGPDGLAALAGPLEEMRGEAARDMRGEGFEAADLTEELELLVKSNGGPEVKIEAPADFFTDQGKIDEAAGRARQALTAAGGSGEGPLEISTFGLIVKAPAPHFQILESPPASGPVDEALKGRRSVYLGPEKGLQDTPVYDWTKLQNGHQVKGPALVESEQTTMLVESNWTLSVDKYGHAVLEEV